MNIRKSNKLGVMFLEAKGFGGEKIIQDLIDSDLKNKEDSFINDESDEDFYNRYKDKGILVNKDLLNFKKKYKLFKLSKNIVDNSRLINIESIKENIDLNDFNFTSLVILLDTDSLIKIERVGSDFWFLYMKDMGGNSNYYLNTYSFLTKDFMFKEDVKNNNFVVQILAYLYYGEITTKYLNPKAKTKINSFSSFVNNSKFNVTYVNSLWKQRICVNGFNVRGHFRMQPIGEGRKKRKLIWIEEFSKDGYNRKSTKELTVL